MILIGKKIGRGLKRDGEGTEPFRIPCSRVAGRRPVVIMSTDVGESVDNSLNSEEGLPMATQEEPETLVLAPSASTLSLSADFDLSHYQTTESLAKVIEIQALWRKVSVLTHFELICTFSLDSSLVSPYFLFPMNFNRIFLFQLTQLGNMLN